MDTEESMDTEDPVIDLKLTLHGDAGFAEFIEKLRGDIFDALCLNVRVAFLSLGSPVPLVLEMTEPVG